MEAAQHSEGGAEAAAASEADGFNRIMSVSTLILVAAVAVLSFLNLFHDRPARAAAPEANGDALSALTQSSDETSQRVARLEEKLDALLAEPAPQASPAVLAGAPEPRRPCVRIYRSGEGAQWACER